MTKKFPWLENAMIEAVLDRRAYCLKGNFGGTFWGNAGHGHCKHC
jgi:hypothetical protein